MIKMFKNKIIILYLTLLTLLPGSVLATNFLEDEDVIWEADKNVFIKYAEQDKSNFGKNDHPVVLKVKEINKALGFLKILEKNRAASDKELKSVFTVEQIDILSQNLAKGLAKDKPNQDINFALEKSLSKFFGLRSNRLFVAGRAFYKDEKLNIIIGDYDRTAGGGFEAAYDPTHMGIVTYHFDHGRRTKSSKGFENPIIAVQGIENKQLKKTRRTDWIVIDLKSVSEGSELRARIHKTEEQARKRKELKELLGSEEASPSHPAAAVPATATRSFEERLTTLNQLRDKGLISDEEYAMKRKQILQDL